MRKTILYWVLTLFMFMGLSPNLMADECTQSFSGSGQDDDPTIVAVSPGDLNCTGGGTIDSVMLVNAGSSISDSYCGSWYNFGLRVDGTVVIDSVCAADLDSIIIPGSFSSLEVFSHDLDNYSDGITISFDLNVYYQPAACPAPTALTVGNITATEALVSWTSGANESNWNIEYGEVGFSLGNGTQVAVTDSFYNITTLSATTQYDVYVQADCGSDQSVWVGPYTFRTACASAYTLPFAESFDSGLGAFINAEGNTKDFNVESTLVAEGTKSIHLSYTANNSDSLIIMCPIDLTTSSHPELRFWQIAKTEGNYDRCFVKISTDGGATWQVLPDSLYMGNGNYGGQFWEDSYTDWGTSDITPDNTWWKQEKFNLEPYKNSSDVYFLFQLTSDGSVQRDGWYLDGVQVNDITCPQPTDIVASNITTTTATLSWITGGSSNWNVVYGPQGFNMTDSSITAVTDTFINITGLNPATYYDFYVQDSCGVGDVSFWTGPYTFMTACEIPTPISSLPWYVDFESGNICDFIIVDSLNNGNKWHFAPMSDIPSGSFSSNGNTSATCALAESSTNQQGANTMLISPEIDLTSVNSSYQLMLEFESQFQAYNVNGEAHLYVSNDNMATWTQLFVETNDEPSTGTIHEFDLSQYIGDNIHIAWQYKSTTGSAYQWAIDNINLYIITCPAPTNLGVIHNSSTSVDLTWTTGGASTWNVLFGRVGFDTTGLGPQAPDITTNPLTVDTLQEQTSYEFYVRDRCSSTDSSVWVGPYTFTTLQSCPLPSDLDAVDLTSSSVNLTWNGYFASTWDVMFGLAGFDTTGTPISYNDVTNDTLLIDTLQSATSYEFYVRADCGSDSSDWAGPFTFNTLCETFVSFPWTETFNSNSQTEQCWTVINQNADGDAWDMNYTSNPFEGDQCAEIYTDYNAGNNDDYLITPHLSLTGGERLVYWVRAQSSYEPNNYEVMVSTTGAQPADFTDLILEDTVSETTYQRRIINLDSYTGDVYIAFHVPSGSLDGWRLYIDSVMIDTIPTVPIVEYDGPNMWDAGEIAVGNSVQSGNIFTIRNVGANSLTITSMTDLSSTEFSTTLSPSLSLASNQEAQFSFSYTPVDDTPDSVAFIIQTNGGDADTIILKGRAYELPPCIVEIGSEQLTNISLPMEPFYGYSYSQSIYLQSELSNEPMINKVYYYYNGNSSWTDSIDVYIGHTTLTVLTDWVDVSTLTHVYSGDFTVPDSTGWVEINLDTPFMYNGTDNIVVALDESTSGYHSSGDDFYCHSTSNNMSIEYHEDGNDVDPTNPPVGTLKSSRPNIRFCMQEPIKDIAVISPVGDKYTCETTGNDNVQLGVKNVGNLVISAGDQIKATFNVDGNIEVDTFALQSDLAVADTVWFTSTQTFDLSGSTAHTYQVIASYLSGVDNDQTNDTSAGTITHYEPVVSINQGDTIVATSNDFPIILTVSGLWESKFWYNADSSQTATSAIFPVSDYGWYYITAVDSNGCEAHDSIFVENATGIAATVQGVKFLVYPNPNNGTFSINISSKETQNINLSVININGKIILEKQLNNVSVVNKTIDISKFSDGVYYLRFESDKFVHQEKIVKY